MNSYLKHFFLSFVDNIHTDYLYGIQEAIGHQDFYPNGGSFQSGCSPLDGIWGKRSFDDFANIFKISVRLDPRFDPSKIIKKFFGIF